MQENLSQFALNNESVTENLHEDFVAIKNALENLTLAINENKATLRAITEKNFLSPMKNLPMVSLVKLGSGKSTVAQKFGEDANFERRNKK